MAITDIKGLDFLNNINIGGIGQTATRFGFFVFILLLCGAIFFYFYNNKRQKKLYNKTLHWWEEVNGQLTPTQDDKACELTIPNTNVKIFYVKSKDLYLPRPTKKTGKDHYMMCIKNNREIVNFVVTNLNREMKEAGLDYDHTDMRYAQNNLMELIKRNYRDKSVTWWKEYKEVIVLVVYLFVMTFCIVIILYRTGILIDKVGILMDTANRIISTTQGSGVVTAPPV